MGAPQIHTLLWGSILAKIYVSLGF